MAVDSRFSSQGTGNLLLGEHTRPIIRIGSKTLIGCFGLESDIFQLRHDLQEKFKNCYDEEIEPEAVCHVISNYLYKSGLYITPIIVGYGLNGPYICSMDSLGAQTVTKPFAAIGTSNSGLLAICESLYEPDLPPHELVSITKKTLSMALQRDVLSGGKVRLLTLKKDGDIFETFFNTEDC